MEYKERLLIEDNRRLAQQLEKLDERIADLELRRAPQYDSEFSTYVGGITQDRREDEEDTLETLAYCISATEELCGISLHDYSSTLLPSNEGLPAGKWREVSMNILVLDSLKAAITIIEGEQNGDHRVLSLECVAGETPLAKSELSGIINECCNSSPPQCEKLLMCLSDYARMNGHRHAVIKSFKTNYPDNIRIHTSEDGVIMQWQGNLFEISWGVQWCDKTERVQDIISIEVGQPANPAFIRESESSFRRLTEFTTSADSRLSCLQTIAKNAKTYS